MTVVSGLDAAGRRRSLTSSVAGEASDLNVAIMVLGRWEHGGVPLEFRRCDAGRPPARELIDAVLDEYDVSPVVRS